MKNNLRIFFYAKKIKNQNLNFSTAWIHGDFIMRIYCWYIVLELLCERSSVYRNTAISFANDFILHYYMQGIGEKMPEYIYILN